MLNFECLKKSLFKSKPVKKLRLAFDLFLSYLLKVQLQKKLKCLKRKFLM